LLMYLDNKILNTTRNTEIFIETAEKFYNSDNDKNEIKLHRIITHALVSKNKDFARDGLEILFKNEPLGDNEKEAAKFLVENVNKRDVLLQILSKYDNKKTK